MARVGDLALLLLEGACSGLCSLGSVVMADQIATPAGKSEQLQKVHMVVCHTHTCCANSWGVLYRHYRLFKVLEDIVAMIGTSDQFRKLAEACDMFLLVKTC